MSLYITEVFSKRNNNNNIQNEKAKEKFIDYVIQEESQFANLKSIEDQLLLSSKRLRDKIDKTDLVIKSKQKEIDDLMSQITSSVKELYQFNLGLFTGISLDNIIKQKRELIRIKEHDYSVYSHIKTRLYNANKLIESRLKSEEKYIKKTQDQAFFYKVIHLKVSKDYGQQNQLYVSLNQKKNESNEQNDKELQSKNRLFEIEQEKLKQKINANSNQEKYYEQLLKEQSRMHQLLSNVNQCNLVQYTDFKFLRRTYKTNEIVLHMIIKSLSTKQLDNIINKVNDKQKKQNDMFMEYIHLNKSINKYSDQITKYDKTISDIKNGIIVKESKEFFLSNEYSDLKIQTKENQLKVMKFCNKEFKMESINKEALMRTLYSFLINKMKVFNPNDKLQSNQRFKCQKEIDVLFSQKRVDNNDIRKYTTFIIHFINLFNTVSYYYLTSSYEAIKSISKDNNTSKKDIGNLMIFYPNEKASNQSREKLKSTNKGLKLKYNQIQQLNPSTLSNSYQTKKKNVSKKASELLFDFKRYLKLQNDNHLCKYVDNYPKKSLTNLSKYYSEANNSEITSASSMRNINLCTKQLISFRKRFAYGLFAVNKASNKKRFQIKDYLSNRSEHVLNDDSYELLSHRQFSNQTQRECYCSKVHWPKEDSDQNKIKARMNDLYQMRVKAEDKLSLKNTNELMETYFQYETKKKNKRYHLQSAYSMKNLFSPKAEPIIMTPKIANKRSKLISTTNCFAKTNYQTNRANSTTDNKNVKETKGSLSGGNTTKNNFHTELNTISPKNQRKNNKDFF